MTHELMTWRETPLSKQNSRILPGKLLIPCSPCSIVLSCSIGIDELYKIRPSWILPGYGESKEWKGHEQNTSMKHVQRTAWSPNLANEITQS